jgi:hypothetical protein
MKGFNNPLHKTMGNFFSLYLNPVVSFKPIIQECPSVQTDISGKILSLLFDPKSLLNGYIICDI